MTERLFDIPGIESGRAVGLILILGVFILGIYYMRRKKLPYIRRVAAIDAIYEAVGRATEMGKPVLCSYGRGGFGYAVIAAMSILGHVAKTCAETNTRLLVPTGGSHTGYLGYRAVSYYTSNRHIQDSIVSTDSRRPDHSKSYWQQLHREATRYLR